MTESDRKYADGKTPDLHPVQIEAYCKMTPEEKFRAIGRLYWQARRTKVAWLHHEHPDWSDEQVLKETRRIFLHANSG